MMNGTERDRDRHGSGGKSGESYANSDRTPERTIGATDKHDLPPAMQSSEDRSRERWLWKLSEALSEARQLLVDLDDGERSVHLIERIDSMQSEVAAILSGTLHGPDWSDPKWIELHPWSREFESGQTPAGKSPPPEKSSR
jgi:hypothetical protein